MHVSGWIGIVFVGLCGAGCSPEPVYTPLPDAAYMPLMKGMFWLYQVDSTVITANVETRYGYQLQVEVIDSISPVPGEVTYLLSRSRRQGASAPFAPLVTWRVQRTAQELILRAGNTAYVALAFPIIRSRDWNGNAYNTLGGNDFCEGSGPCDVYTYTQVRVPRELGEKTFSDVVTVEEGNTPDRLVRFDLRMSHYARDIGLIERDYQVLNYCSQPACYGRQFVDRGIVFSQRLISYGRR